MFLKRSGGFLLRNSIYLLDNSEPASTIPLKSSNRSIFISNVSDSKMVFEFHVEFGVRLKYLSMAIVIYSGV